MPEICSPSGKLQRPRLRATFARFTCKGAGAGPLLLRHIRLWCTTAADGPGQMLQAAASCASQRIAQEYADEPQDQGNV